LLTSEYFMIFFVFLLGSLTIFYIFYHIKHNNDFSSLKIERFKKIASEVKNINNLPPSLLKKVEIFLKYVDENTENNVFEIERKLGIDIEVLEKKLLKVNNFKDNKMDNFSFKKEVYKELATSLLGVLSFIVDKKIVSKTVYFVSEPNGNTFLVSKAVDELLEIKNDCKVTLAIIKEGMTAADSKEIIIEGNVKVIDYSDNETWSRALELFKKKSPFISNIEVLGSKKEYILLCLYPVVLTYNTIAGEREGKPPVIMLKKGENLWE